MMKRVVFLSLALLLIMPAFAVAAPSDDIRNFGQGVADSLGPVIEFVVGGNDALSGFDSSEAIFAKFLFLILVFAVVWAVLSKAGIFGSNGVVLVVITAAIALLSTRWLGDNSIVQAVLLPYSALGVSLSVALPFIFWFFFVNMAGEGKPPIVRRVLWILFGVVFVFLWFYRYDLSSFSWMYLVVFVLSLLMAFLDGTIQRFMVKLQTQRMGAETAEEAIIDLKKKIAELPDLVKDSIITSVQADVRKKRYQKRIAYLSSYT